MAVVVGYFPHITSAKAKLRDRLSQELPKRLADADLAANDGVHTPPPYEIFTTDKADLGGLPSIELIVTDSEPSVDSYARIYRHRVLMGVSCGGDNEEAISVQVERYLWCFRGVIRDLDITPIEGTGPVDTGSEQYAPLQQRPGTVEWPFVKAGYLEIFVQTVE